jgi:hypothetical protein
MEIGTFLLLSTKGKKRSNYVNFSPTFLFFFLCSFPPSLSSLMADPVAEAKRLKVERMEPYFGADAEEVPIDEVKK